MNKRYFIFSSFNQLLCHFSKRKNLTYNNQRYAILVHLHRAYTEDLASFLYLFCVHWCWHIVKSKPKNRDTVNRFNSHDFNFSDALYFGIFRLFTFEISCELTFDTSIFWGFLASLDNLLVAIFSYIQNICFLYFEYYVLKTNLTLPYILWYFIFALFDICLLLIFWYLSFWKYKY